MDTELKQEATMSFKNPKFIIAVATIGVVMVSAIAYFVFMSRTSTSAYNLPSTVSNNVASSTEDNFAITHDKLVEVQAEMGTTTPVALGDTYNVFVQIDYNETLYHGVTYYEDGIITAGPYSGYRRILASLEPDGPVGVNDYVTLATKDYRTFILHAPANGRVPNPMLFNTNVVIKADVFPTNFPETIAVSKNFVLERENIVTATSSILGPELTSTSPGLRFYTNPGDYTHSDFDAYKFVTGDTSIVVRDTADIKFVYYIAFSDAKKTDWMVGDIGIKLPAESGLYSSYGKALPRGCGGEDTSQSYVLTNTANNEVQSSPIAEAHGVDLYRFTDTNNLLVKAEYDAKSSQISAYLQQDPSSSNWLTAVPNYTEYVKKTPILLFRDPWDRWVAVGEIQYELPGGCGKPVIYLYPEKPTEVSVKFANKPKFSVDIPTYADEWHVLADKNGNLHDLQPNKTDCAGIDSTAFGSDYAKQSCRAGRYPYLYWSGEAAGTYPSREGGWVIERADVGTFLESKLREIGLNEQERQDMLSFWVPTLKKAESPYYSISFFTTKQMNHFIPMRVTPAPSSVLRVFLDWKPLIALPSSLPTPQVFAPFERKGFTLVEWGGLEYNK